MLVIPQTFTNIAADATAERSPATSGFRSRTRPAPLPDGSRAAPHAPLAEVWCPIGHQTSAEGGSSE